MILSGYQLSKRFAVPSYSPTKEVLQKNSGPVDIMQAVYYDILSDSVQARQVCLQLLQVELKDHCFIMRSHRLEFFIHALKMPMTNISL